MAPSIKKAEASHDSWLKDGLASLVVFLVALPLCMGIAIASGLHPAAGLLTGIIGGIVVGSLSGCPLQVSGPAAGLTVIVWEIVQRFGVPALGLIVIAAGLCQLTFGLLKLGQIFRAVSPAVVQGMLSGIGVLIFASQFHVMIDDKPKGSGLDNLLAIPGALINCLTLNHDVNHIAALLGLITIAIVVLWEKLPIARLRSAVPPTLLSILVVTSVATVMGLTVNRVSLPENLLTEVKLPNFSLIWSMGWMLIQQGLIVALIASAETLLTANAVDRMVPGNKSKYDQELIAQGVGNTVCGLVGALPLTGVIVRSSVNIKAGAKTRRSAILHGIWLLLFTLCFPFVLRLIPTAALAALLVYTGYKLLDIGSIKRLAQYGSSELIIFATTMITILATDLLTGVLTGVIVSLLKLVRDFCKLEIARSVEDDNRIVLKLTGAATFLSLPKLAGEIENIPHSTQLHVDFSELNYIDHACLDLFNNWEKHHTQQGGTVSIHWGGLEDRLKVQKTLKSETSISSLR